MATGIGAAVMNVFLAALAPFIFPFLAIYFMKLNDWPRARRRCTSKRDLTGKTALITGANAGIGMETALEFARRGARVIMACRNTKKAESVCATIIGETGNRNVVVMELDLADLESIRSLAKKVISQESHLEILVNNAGVVAPGRTKQGYDMTIGTNYVGHFLLTHLLSELMKKSAPSRVVNVSSVDHARVKKLDLSYCTTTPNRYSGDVGLRQYSLSKLYLILHAKELGRRLKDTGVTTYALHPGFVRTNLMSGTHAKVPAMMSIMYKLAERFAGLDEVVGAQTTLYCALEESIQNESGKYYDNCRQKKLSFPLAIDDHVSAELWDTTLSSLRQNGYL